MMAARSFGIERFLGYTSSWLRESRFLDVGYQRLRVWAFRCSQFLYTATDKAIWLAGMTDETRAHAYAQVFEAAQRGSEIDKLEDISKVMEALPDVSFVGGVQIAGLRCVLAEMVETQRVIVRAFDSSFGLALAMDLCIQIQRLEDCAKRSSTPVALMFVSAAQNWQVLANQQVFDIKHILGGSKNI